MGPGLQDAFFLLEDGLSTERYHGPHQNFPRDEVTD